VVGVTTAAKVGLDGAPPAIATTSSKSTISHLDLLTFLCVSLIWPVHQSFIDNVVPSLGTRLPSSSLRASVIIYLWLICYCLYCE